MARWWERWWREVFLEPGTRASRTLGCTMVRARVWSRTASRVAAILLDRRSADGACVVLTQPHVRAFLVEPVLAREVDDDVALVQLFDANGALGLTLRPQHALVHRLLLQFVDGILRRGRGRVGLRILLHHGRHDSIKGFLCVHSVPILPVPWRQQTEQLTQSSSQVHGLAGDASTGRSWRRARAVHNVSKHSVEVILALASSGGTTDAPGAATEADRTGGDGEARVAVTVSRRVCPDVGATAAARSVTGVAAGLLRLTPALSMLLFLMMIVRIRMGRNRRSSRKAAKRREHLVEVV